MPRDARKEGLPRRHRFAERAAFGPVLKGGRKLKGRYAVLHAAPAPGGIARIGVTLARRTVRAAVERNRIRRIVREAFRRHVARQLPVDCVVALRQAVPSAELPMLRIEINALLDQLCRGR